MRRRLVFLLFAYMPLAQAANESQDQGHEQIRDWSSAYLLNTTFAVEFRTVLSTVKPQSHGEFFASQAGQQLYKRALFAHLSAKAKKQTLPNQKWLESQLSAVAPLVSTPKEAETMEAKIAKNKWSDISLSFSSGAWNENFNMFAAKMANGSPSCKLSYDKVKMYADHHNSLKTSGKSYSARELTAPILAWDKSRVQCLMLTMLAADKALQDEQGYDPLPSLVALRQLGHAVANTEVFSVMLAIRYIQSHHYAEALRALIKLQDVNPSYRLPYEFVQRIYSYSQRGQGQVALKGL